MYSYLNSIRIDICRKRSSSTTSSKNLARRIAAEGEGEAAIWNQRGGPPENEGY